MIVEMGLNMPDAQKIYIAKLSTSSSLRSAKISFRLCEVAFATIFMYPAAFDLFCRRIGGGGDDVVFKPLSLLH